MTVVRNWHSLPREAVNTPSLDIFRAILGGTLTKLILLILRELNCMIFKCPYPLFPAPNYSWLALTCFAALYLEYQIWWDIAPWPCVSMSMINIIHFYRMKERYSTHFAKICLLWFLIYVEFLIPLCHTDNLLKFFYIEKYFVKEILPNLEVKKPPENPKVNRNCVMTLERHAPRLHLSHWYTPCIYL